MDASGTGENAHDRTFFFAVKYPKEGVFMGQKEESMIAYYNNPDATVYEDGKRYI